MSYTVPRCAGPGRAAARAPRTGAARRPRTVVAVSAPYAPPPFPESWPISQLQPQDVVDTLATSYTPPHASTLTAFYSSELGGVTTEPGLFVVHADDHAFHRGHAVFDTVEIIEGCAYDLDAHLARFFKSADAARLALPCTRAQVKRVVLETAAAGRAMDGHVRYWLGAGRGGMKLSSSDCVRPSLFALAYKTAPTKHATADPVGVSVCTATCVAAPDPPLATMKSTNYLRHALAQMEAEDKGFEYAVFQDARGCVTDGATMTVGVVTRGGEFVVPPDETGLASCTAARVMQLIPKWLDLCPDLRDHINTVVRRPLPLAEAKACPFAFVMGSSARLAPIVRWDEVELGSNEGVPSLLAMRMTELFEQDRDPMACPDDWMHVDVPFTILTGAGGGGTI